MATNTYTPDAAESAMDRSGIGGQPAGLTTLFFTEMWERFSYYGMRAILIYYMTATLADGGLELDTPRATIIYGTYTAAVYLLSLPGGWVADNVLGARLTVLFGGIAIALGEFSLAAGSMPTFYGGMVLIVLGTGMLKPNISTMVGSLYSEDDPRRDAGFSIFYMGINLGAFLAPLVCGFLAQGEWFKGFLGRVGISPRSSWRWGFGAAGVGMVFGLVQYLAARRRLAHVGNRPERSKSSVEETAKSESAQSTGPLVASPAATLAKVISYVLWTVAALFAVALVVVLVQWVLGAKTLMNPEYGLSLLLLSFFFASLGVVAGYFRGVLERGERARAAEEGKRVGVIGILFLFSALFWMAFEQAGSSLSLFAKELTRNSVFGWSFPASWFQSVNSIFIIALAPVFSWLWLRLKNRQPTSPAKFAYGLLFAGLGFLVVAFASSLSAGGGRVSPMWLVLVYLLHTVGELCLSPVGLSTMTKLAPARLLGMMMGVWFLSISFGNYVAGWVAGNFDPKVEGALVKMFGTVALTTIVAAGILALLAPYIRKLMGRVH